MEKIDYENFGKCLERILDSDRSSINSFHENFVCALADFGLSEYISVDEMKWYQDYVENEESYLGIDDYLW